jgi:hypothetical protein
MQGQNKLDLFGINFFISRGIRLPQNLFADREFATLFFCEICGYKGAIGASEVVYAAR